LSFTTLYHDKMQMHDYHLNYDQTARAIALAKARGTSTEAGHLDHGTSSLEPCHHLHSFRLPSNPWLCFIVEDIQLVWCPIA
jgi:hypothetical protein